MPGSLPKISYASVVVGFISFAFTFFTFLRVFWATILTLWSAPREMTAYLDNLRSELHEERAYFRAMLRRHRSRSRGRRRDSVHDDLAVIKLLNDSVKNLMRRFKDLEAPFLMGTPEQQEKDVERSEESVRGDYAPMTIARRWGESFGICCTTLKTPLAVEPFAQYCPCQVSLMRECSVDAL